MPRPVRSASATMRLLDPVVNVCSRKRASLRRRFLSNLLR